jgi:bacterioferritin
MKGNEKIIDILNYLLADELTATNQYMVHAEMCDNWGYKRLAEYIEKRAITEMKHAEKLIARILFLEGIPIVSHLHPMAIGADVQAQFKNDQASEEGAVKAYNEAVKLAYDLSDGGTRILLESILKDEEEHLDWLEMQSDQISHMGFKMYLVEQTD